VPILKKKKWGQVCAIIGAQWGDEGKGKIVDSITQDFDVVARASGGANAGHTVVVGEKEYKFHLLPSASIQEGKELILGSGMVLHLPTLLEEIQHLREEGIDIFPRLKISYAAHIVFEGHKERDAEAEKNRKDGEIGTTLRGIGPAYMDKAARVGVRMETLLQHSKIPSPQDSKQELQKAKQLLAPCVVDTVSLIHQRLKEGKKILIEGAQGVLLDIDHGTYPYVTSSATTAAAALHALGLPPRSLASCIGVVKAYCTRVGSGSFPTEAEEKLANHLREKGGEYGTTTGRPRRCGWLSIVDLKRVSAINGFTHLALTKLDVLDGLKEIPVCMEMNGKEPRYENLPGWNGEAAGITDFKKLPKEAQEYVLFIEKHVGVPISMIGTGKERGDVITKF
jgi:adenylosuccinate synthase